MKSYNYQSLNEFLSQTDFVWHLRSDMKNKAITLCQIRNSNTGNLVRERLTKGGVDEVRRCLDGMSVDFDDFLAEECSGPIDSKAGSLHSQLHEPS